MTAAKSAGAAGLIVSVAFLAIAIVFRRELEDVRAGATVAPAGRAYDAKLARRALAILADLDATLAESGIGERDRAFNMAWHDWLNLRSLIAVSRVIATAALAMLGPQWGFRELIDIPDEEARDNLARASVMALSFVAQSARGIGRPPVSQREVDKARSIPERFLIRWRGEADPRHVKAIDAYWNSAAEHGMNASTFTARVVASTGADVAAALSAAVGALSGPLHGGAPSRVLQMLDDVAVSGDAGRYVKQVLDSGQRLMGFGHRIYRAEDPRARVLRRTAKEIDAPRVEVAEALEQAALAELQARRPDRVLATNVEFWSAVVLDFAEIPPELFTPMFTCARTAGWSAHIMEQKREGRLIRPTAKYVGPPPRPLSELR